jgi:hypothetical protein|tara:strand:- start:327 stop:542 length:216 start_codon:yes stop_codon:yes gene_type:complete
MVYRTRPKIGSVRKVASMDGGRSMFEQVIAVRKGSKPFRGIKTPYYATTRTYSTRGSLADAKAYFKRNPFR